MTWSLRLSGGVVVPTATQANLALPRSCSEDRRAGEVGEVSRFRAGKGGACHVITAPAITMPTMHFDTPSSLRVRAGVTGGSEVNGRKAGRSGVPKKYVTRGVNR
ncbi:hypothetical protein HPB50_017235 [Hyalomma asiaticum]|uniref:Uncharacterized protein n=1 Tax=Hyalomma asiaticum TaxID=266040 RepID=A0ACB7THY0_HYAAI|nr:hypothetical protein HPB50_017235 [Hyalomma asiaticum]